MSIKAYFVLLSILTAIVPSHTQEILSLSRAIDLAKGNNLSISLAQKSEDIADAQIYKAAVGNTPRIDWNVNINGGGNYLNQEFVDGRLIDRTAVNFAPNTNIVANYTLYDGGSMAARYKILQQQGQQSKTMTAMTTEDIENQVILAYHNIARQKESIAFQRAILKYYEERKTITNERWTSGKVAKLDYLQAQNDYNSQLANIQSAELILDNLKVILNVLINRDASTLFDIEELKDEASLSTLEDSWQKANANAEELKLLQLDRSINALRVDDLRGTQKPRVGAIATLGYSLNRTTAGLILLNQNVGGNLGLSATWNLYDGGHVSKQIEIAKMRNDLLDLQRKTIETRLRSELIIAYNQLNASKKIYQLESENKSLAEENLNIALEKYRLGASTILEVNDAQQRYDAAVNRFVNARYAVIFANLEIQRLER
jgi:outer membrane protein